MEGHDCQDNVLLLCAIRRLRVFSARVFMWRLGVCVGLFDFMDGVQIK